MKAEEFVKQHYKDAKALHTASPYNSGMKHKRTIIRATNKIGIQVNLAVGKSESNAWVNAKKVVKELLGVVIMVFYFAGCAAGKPRNLPSARVEYNPEIFCKITDSIYESRRFRYVKGKRGYIAFKK